jgi:hypothetical protein
MIDLAARPTGNRRTRRLFLSAGWPISVPCPARDAGARFQPLADHVPRDELDGFAISSVK